MSFYDVNVKHWFNMLRLVLLLLDDIESYLACEAVFLFAIPYYLQPSKWTCFVICDKITLENINFLQHLLYLYMLTVHQFYSSSTLINNTVASAGKQW